MFTIHKVIGRNGGSVMMGETVLFKHKNPSGAMALSAGILTQIFEDETTGKMQCGMRRFTEKDATYLQLDWTASGLVVVDATALCDDVPVQVLDKETYSQLTEHERLAAGIHCCKEALVDVHGEPRVVPVEDAPQHFTQKHHIDMHALDTALEARPDLRVVRAFLTMFSDDFAAYSKVYHKTNGKYISLGNLPYAHQCLLRNVMAVTIAPPGTPPAVASAAFIAGCKKLAKPTVVDLGPVLGKKMLVGGLGCLLVDCPEGQDICGCKRQNAHYGCRVCLSHKTQIDDLAANPTLRTTVNMDKVRAAAEAPGVSAKEKATILASAGLHERGFLFAELPVDQWSVAPYDVFHLMVIGLITLLLSIFASSLKPMALRELNWLLHHARPRHWSSMPLLVLTSTAKTAYQHLKGCGESVRQQIQLLPLLVINWLNPDKFKKSWLKELEKKHTTPDAAVTLVISSITSMAHAYRHVFALSIVNDPGAFVALRDAVYTARKFLKLCWSGIRTITFANTTNFHSASHLVKIAHDFGLCRLVSCATGECKHAALKTASRNTNHANIDLDMFTSQNIQQALTFLVAGGHKHIPNASSIWSNDLLTSLNGDPMWKELLALTGPSTSYISSDFSDKKSDLSQDPSSPSVVLSNLLGQDALSQLPSFASASFPDREDFCSKVFPGEFYYVHHHTFQFARADAILQLPDDNVVCRLTSMVPVGTDPVLSCPSLVASTVHVLPIDLLAQPVHIVPICMPDSSCIIEHRTKLPGVFPYQCFGLQGTHSPADLYLFNKFFIK